VWRMLIQEDLKSCRTSLREVLAAGEPLNPEVIEQVEKAWGLTIRDFYGQTETTTQVGNPPGQPIKPGSMGRPLPGYRIRLLDADDKDAEEGEICSDVASRDSEGYLTYVGRADDVFKASDYRISPFELESILIEHPAVAEAAVVPAPDAMRLAVPKAYITLTASGKPDRATALSIFQHLRGRLAPFKRIRRLEFAELPKTISGKIRRVELRRDEEKRAAENQRGAGEFREEDFPELAK
jgi:acetyl-CoA synthetase